MDKGWKRTFIVVIVMVSFLILPIYSLELENIEILTGFLKANLENQDDYEGTPIFLSFDYNGDPILEEVGINHYGHLNLILEPFLNPIISPDYNVEVGSNFLIKYTFPLTEKIKPYVKGGLGVLYMSYHADEQGSQYNFLPQAGLGLHFFLEDKLALTVEYRYRHLSNASFDEPNSGIDANLYLTGIAIFF